ncbi:MAG: PEGA domain-containing protein [Candidatus Methylomirabilis sp.]|nr:PEGA domain-containing protein [Candidatus Methylomirabilis sp.]
MKEARLAALLFALVALAGCASIVSGRTQEVSFTSNPEGATVTVNGRIIGKTPLTANLQREKGQSLAFSKEGYKTLSREFETDLNGWFWGNIVIGGLPDRQPMALPGPCTSMP